MSTATATATRRRASSDLQPEQVTAIVDTREQAPLDLAPLRMAGGTLATGDYSVRGLENHIAIERKSLPDFVACCGVERERFEREVQRLLAYHSRAVVIEASYRDLEVGGWRSQISPASVSASVLGWSMQGVPFLLAGDRAGAERAVAKMLFLAARRWWRIARQFATSIEAEETDQ